MDALLQLSEFWTRATPGQNCASIYDQINYIKKKITEELKKE